MVTPSMPPKGSRSVAPHEISFRALSVSHSWIGQAQSETSFSRLTAWLGRFGERSGGDEAPLLGDSMVTSTCRATRGLSPQLSPGPEARRAESLPTRSSPKVP